MLKRKRKKRVDNLFFYAILYLLDATWEWLNKLTGNRWLRWWDTGGAAAAMQNRSTNRVSGNNVFYYCSNARYLLVYRNPTSLFYFKCLFHSVGVVFTTSFFIQSVIISSVAFGDKTYTRLLKENYDLLTKVSHC